MSFTETRVCPWMTQVDFNRPSLYLHRTRVMFGVGRDHLVVASVLVQQRYDGLDVSSLDDVEGLGALD